MGHLWCDAWRCEGRVSSSREAHRNNRTGRTVNSCSELFAELLGRVTVVARPLCFCCFYCCDHHEVFMLREESEKRRVSIHYKPCYEVIKIIEINNRRKSIEKRLSLMAIKRILMIINKSEKSILNE